MSGRDRHTEEFIITLERLSGDNFQDGVFCALNETYLDTQAVPKRPSGDGGLDILTDSNTIGYCCYGLERETITTNEKATIRKYIVDKYKSDLMRLLELETKSKKFVHKKNDELSDILKTKKLKAIKLVCNYFSDNKIIGDIQKVFTELLKHSKKRFVESNCAIVILGPTQLASLCTIDSSILIRLKYPDLVDLNSIDPAPALLPSSQKDMDLKFDHLVAKSTNKAATINQIREEFRSDWSRAIAIMKKLETEYPDIHRTIENIVSSCAKDAKIESTRNDLVAQTMIKQYQERLQKTISDQCADKLPAELISSLAQYHTAKLVGECPIDWR